MSGSRGIPINHYHSLLFLGLLNETHTAMDLRPFLLLNLQSTKLTQVHTLVKKKKKKVNQSKWCDLVLSIIWPFRSSYSLFIVSSVCRLAWLTMVFSLWQTRKAGQSPRGTLSYLNLVMFRRDLGRLTKWRAVIWQRLRGIKKSETEEQEGNLITWLTYKGEVTDRLVPMVWDDQQKNQPQTHVPYWWHLRLPA